MIENPIRLINKFQQELDDLMDKSDFSYEEIYKIRRIDDLHDVFYENYCTKMEFWDYWNAKPKKFCEDCQIEGLEEEMVQKDAKWFCDDGCLAEREDDELSNRYEDRLDLPEAEWIELPPGKSIIDFYKERKKGK